MTLLRCFRSWHFRKTFGHPNGRFLRNVLCFLEAPPARFHQIHRFDLRVPTLNWWWTGSLQLGQGKEYGMAGYIKWFDNPTYNNIQQPQPRERLRELQVQLQYDWQLTMIIYTLHHPPRLPQRVTPYLQGFGPIALCSDFIGIVLISFWGQERFAGDEEQEIWLQNVLWRAKCTRYSLEWLWVLLEQWHLRHGFLCVRLKTSSFCSVLAWAQFFQISLFFVSSWFFAPTVLVVVLVVCVAIVTCKWLSWYFTCLKKI